jgi:hypothetical protein
LETGRWGSMQDHSVSERSVWYALLMLGRIPSYPLKTPFRTVSPRTPVNKGKRRKGRSLLEVGTSAKTHLGELHPLAVVSYYVLGVD